MKIYNRLFAAAMTAAVIVGACFCQGTVPAFAAESAGSYIPGTYSSSEYGMLDYVTVTVTFDEESITDVIIEGNETDGIGSTAIEEMPAQILEAQSADVDGVSGATVTSTAIRTALANCIAQALGEDTDTNSDVGTTADVIVVGAGGAGLAAAAGAGEAGASVIVLEANGRAGGSTSLSGGHLSMINKEMNAAMERNDEDLEIYLTYDPDDFGEWADDLITLQEQITEYMAGDETGRFDSYERLMIDHYLTSSGTDLDGNEATLDYELNATALAANMEILEWLMDGGMEIQDSYYKEHSCTPVGSGQGLVDAELTLAENAGAQIVYNTRATELIADSDGKIVAVVAEDSDGNEITYTANCGVIIVTGSFSSNSEMASEYQNISTGLNEENGSTNPDTNQGDGIIMSEAAGAALRDMQFMSTMIYGYNNGCSYITWSQIAGTQQLTVNSDGVRYCDETSSSMTAELINQPGGLMYLVGDSKMISALNEIEEGFVDSMVEAGVCFTGDTLEEAAEAAGLDPDVLANTVTSFNEAVESGTDTEYGRTEFNGAVEEGPYIIAVGEAFYHLTFGGLVINTDAHVLNGDGEVISGLYAAGDVVSGLEGAAHDSGVCLTTAIYYGKVAGENAAAAQ
ncbi:MAG: FAD-dependent oxidoreductase [Lachnospiraceae bacterium]|nr:FAD-dependent oxidoreductase [Lachnospiraceae bacterium]